MKPLQKMNGNNKNIADINFRIVKPCSRCIIPSIDIDSAERSKDKKPTQTLITFRKRDHKIFFGQNVIADGDGIFELGMKVDIVE
ncbi:MAG: MOSC domain-containing protein [Gammaproteobacteria bacterium]|nr:MOSC domain-containing protein [Gammaproteobacteria bacterium]